MMSSVASPSTAGEALGMLRSAMGYLAAADATAMAAETQARCLQALEQINSMGTAARASILAAFTSGQGYSADADYSPRAWLINRTWVTKGAAVAYTAWVRRAAAHPEVAAALAAGEMSESFARTICTWTDKLPEDCREAADAILLAAAKGGADLRDLAGLAGEIYAGSLPEDPDKDRDQAFEDRSVRLETTFDGAGVLHGDLTPECASVVTTVLDALSAPAGAEDTRSQAQRYHDGLHQAMQRLVTAGLLPERAGQPVKAWVHISLADLMMLDGDSALQQEWTSRVRAQWTAHRAQASAGGSDGGAWLDGDAATAMACDATMTPIVTGDVNPAALDDLVRLCVQLDRLRHHPWTGQDNTGTGGSQDAPAPDTTQAWEASSKPSTARRWILSRVRAGWRRSCAAGSWAPGWAARACRWISATARPSRPGSVTRSSCGTSTASGPGAATSPRRRVRCTMSSIRRTAARPAFEIVFYCAGSITRLPSTDGAGPWF